MKKIKFVSLLVLVILLSSALFPLSEAYAASIKLNTKQLIITIDETYNLKIIGSSSTATWKSSDKKIATVSSKGKVKGISAGDVVITATVKDKKLKCEVRVEKKIENEPDIEAYLFPTNDVTSVIAVVITNNGDLPIKIESYGYVYNDTAYLSSPVYLFDDKDKKTFELINSKKVKSGKTVNLFYRTDDDNSDSFWLGDDTSLLFNFTYDGVKFYGSTDSDGNFRYQQGRVPEDD